MTYITFDQFQESRTYTEDLGRFENSHSEGYVYLDSFYIVAQPGSDGNEYWVQIGNSEDLFFSLNDAERFLWQRFANEECNASRFDRVPTLNPCEVNTMTNNPRLKPCKFYIADDPVFDGFTDGTTWNGWDNIWVTAETHHKMVEMFRNDFIAAGYTGADLDEAMEWFDIEPDSDGLYSYARGFCTQIETD